MNEIPKEKIEKQKKSFLAYYNQNSHDIYKLCENAAEAYLYQLNSKNDKEKLLLAYFRKNNKIKSKIIKEISELKDTMKLESGNTQFDHGFNIALSENIKFLNELLEIF